MKQFQYDSSRVIGLELRLGVEPPGSESVPVTRSLVVSHIPTPSRRSDSDGQNRQIPSHRSARRGRRRTTVTSPVRVRASTRPPSQWLGFSVTVDLEILELLNVIEWARRSARLGEPEAQGIWKVALLYDVRYDITGMSLWYYTCHHMIRNRPMKSKTYDIMNMFLCYHTNLKVNYDTWITWYHRHMI
jgi:hypothetical protein